MSGQYDFHTPIDLATRVQNLINWWRHSVDQACDDDNGSITIMANQLERVLNGPDETDTTAAEFDAMWKDGTPVETITKAYDWVDDPNMSAEETMRRFEALGPDATTGPSRKQSIRMVAEAIWEHEFQRVGTAGGSLDLSDCGLAAAIVDRLAPVNR